jgi:hypothetical protein
MTEEQRAARLEFIILQKREQAPAPNGDVGFRVDKKAADVNVALPSRQMQCGALTAKTTNQQSQTEFRFEI